MHIDQILAYLDAAGVKIFTLVFGVIGAALGIAYTTPPMSRREMAAALLAGLACAAIGPQILLHYMALPSWGTNAAAFVLGIGGMFIVPGILKAWRAFAADPLSLLNRNKGGNP